MEVILPVGTFREKINIKRSVFIGTVSEAHSVEEAKSFIKEVSKEFYDATHNCWAYRIYNGDSVVEHYSDAGEPSGSAGLPILNTIRSKNMLNVVVVVSRYFGGVKLGKRGLIDAYSLVTEKVIEAVKKCKGKIANVYSLTVDIKDYGKVKAIVTKNGVVIEEKFNGLKVSIRYASDRPLVDGSNFEGREIVFTSKC